ncbi:MAG: hypothetical protein HFG82_14740 [Dorea sp.]|nr:hypothetical protein [Dorea sp.]
MITYQDFFLFCTFIVALISLLYQISSSSRLSSVIAITSSKEKCSCSLNADARLILKQL